MQIHSLGFDDFFDDNYTLIAVHTTLEDYRLAFMLNKYIHIKLNRRKLDLDVKHQNNNAFYSVFEYENELEKWFLVANTYKIKTTNIGIFSESETVIPLIAEKKKVDYFIKIEGNITTIKNKKITDNINKIPQVITSYIIDIATIKSKEYLIFDNYAKY